ncbi:MAG: cytidine deaminase [Mesonia hippocampi]|uniref:cytidine deaminase n=1 Tax=Mesonia hippocampi TaxID=1628250 RepID=UPI003F9AB275
MEERKIETTYTVYAHVGELEQAEQTLMQKAAEARDKAYAPYSKFHVGAAILLSSGAIVTGSNQENAAYPSGLCAERTAIYYAGANFPNDTIAKIAITVKSETTPVNSPASPCGACRQAIAEYEFKQKQPIEIIFMGETGEVYKVKSLTALLPFTFNSSYLKK